MVETTKYHVLTPEQYDVFKDDFYAIDTNHSGAIDKSELVKLLEKQLKRPVNKREISLTFSKFDLDKDGLITLSE